MNFSTNSAHVKIERKLRLFPSPIFLLETFFNFYKFFGILQAQESNGKMFQKLTKLGELNKASLRDVVEGCKPAQWLNQPTNWSFPRAIKPVHLKGMDSPRNSQSNFSHYLWFLVRRRNRAGCEPHSGCLPSSFILRTLLSHWRTSA